MMNLSPPIQQIRNRRLPAGVLTACFGLSVFLTGQPLPAQEKPALLEYAADDFSGGAFVRLGEIRQSDRYHLLPLDILIPSNIFLDRIDEKFVSELAIFLRDGSNLNLPTASRQKFELAAAARLSPQAIRLDVAELLRRYRQRLTPWQQNVSVQPDFVMVGDRKCHVVPAGTLLNSRHRYGTLHFLDREGKKADTGINVGDYSPRGFIEGQTESRAVFEFAGISSTDLIGEKLTLELRPDVFFTRHSLDEYCPAELLLQWSENGLRSQPIQFEARSHAEHTFEFPRKLAVTDSIGQTRQVDLIDDFSRDGRVQVVLKCNEATTYLGAVETDLNIKNRALEYLAIDGDILLVAQSPATLKRMLSKKGTRLSKNLHVTSNQQVLGYFDLRAKPDALGFHDFLGLLSLETATTRLPVSTNAIRLSVSHDTPTLMQLNIEVNNREANAMKERFKTDARSATESLRDQVTRFAQTQDAMANLLRFGFPGISLLFPDEEISRDKYHARLQKMVDRLHSHLEFDAHGEQLTIQFRWPFDDQARPDELDRIVLAMIQRWRSDGFYQQKQFFEFARSDRRVLDHFPTAASLWHRYAHQLAYNTSHQFDGYQTKYYWIRSGIIVLLDGADQTPDALDFVWLAARFIGHKIGNSDDNRKFQELFANDTALHHRLKKYVDLENARDPEAQVNCFLTAKALFEHCQQRVGTSGTISLSPFRRASQLAVITESYARSLDAQGKCDQAAVEWNNALQAYETLGNQLIRFDSKNSMPVRNARQFMKNFKPENIEDPIFQLFQLDSQWYEKQLARANVELLPTARDSRKIESRANQFLIQRKKTNALEMQLLAVEGVLKLLRQHPEKTNDVLLTFSDLFRSTKNLAEQLNGPIPPDVQAIFDQNSKLKTWPTELRSR